MYVVLNKGYRLFVYKTQLFTYLFFLYKEEIYDLSLNKNTHTFL